MAYAKQTWQDNNLTYPVSAARMGAIENGIEAAALVADQGHRIFTTEAARDAVITSPTEGMMVYLSAPTEPNATGATTIIPSGVQTIYNGSVWVCVTDVGAYTSTNGSRTLASYGALTGGGTNPSVTLRTGTTALVTFSCEVQTTTANASMYLGTSVSGATTRATSDPLNAYTMAGTLAQYYYISKTVLFSGLTAGVNTFTLDYYYNYATAGTGYWYERSLSVRGVA